MSTPRRALGELPATRSRNPHTYARRRIGETAVPPRISIHRMVDENVPPGQDPRPTSSAPDDGDRKNRRSGPGSGTASVPVGPPPANSDEPKGQSEPEKESLGLKRKASRNGNIMDFFKKRPVLDAGATIDSEHGFVDGKSESATVKGVEQLQDLDGALTQTDTATALNGDADVDTDKSGQPANPNPIKDDNGHKTFGEHHGSGNDDGDEADYAEAEEDEDEGAYDDKDEDSIQIPQIRLFGRKNAKSRSASARPKPILHQATIDIGQKMEIDCKGCGMSYIPSNQKDKKLHEKFHKSYLQTLTWSDTQSVVWSGSLPKEEDNGVIVCVTGHSLNKDQKKACEIVQQVEGQLGSVEGSWGGLGGAADRKVYLYIVAKKTVGCLVVERIHTAYPALVTADGMIEEDISKGANEVIMGVSRIWVAATNRRKGIASKLIDCAQSNFIYGTHIEKTQVAFSQPTESGGRFARGWWGDEGWLVYDQDKVYNVVNNGTVVETRSA